MHVCCCCCVWVHVRSLKSDSKRLERITSFDSTSTQPSLIPATYFVGSSSVLWLEWGLEINWPVILFPVTMVYYLVSFSPDLLIISCGIVFAWNMTPAIKKTWFGYNVKLVKSPACVFFFLFFSSLCCVGTFMWHTICCVDFVLKKKKKSFVSILGIKETEHRGLGCVWATLLLYKEKVS